jgi:hypothetical protein
MTGSIKYSVTEPTIINIVPTHTSIAWQKMLVANTYSQDLYFTDFHMNDNNFLDYECVLMSGTVEAEKLVNDTYKSSYVVKGTLSSNNSWQSPLIDLRQMHAVIVGNIINFDLAGETNPSGGASLSKYLSKPISLSVTADELQVYLTIHKPQDTGVAVYGKFKHGEDVSVFGGHSWVKLESTGEGVFSSTLDKNDFFELSYTIPLELMTGPDGEFQYRNQEGMTFTGFNTFAIKIVLSSLNAAVVPRVKNARGIALQL